MKKSRNKLTIRPHGPAQPAAAQSLAASNQPAPLQPQLRINWWVLVGSVVGLLLTVAIASAVHSWQMHGLADALFARAQQHREAGDWSLAAETFHRFLQMRPNDAAAKTELAECFDRAHPEPQQRQRVIDLYYQATSAAPQNPSLRLRLAQLLLDQQRFAPAAEQAQLVLTSRPADKNALRIAALALNATRQQQKRPLDDRTREAFAVALAASPGDVGLVAAAADCLRSEGQRLHRLADMQAADLAFDNLIQASPDDAAAWLARHRYRRQQELPGADADLAQASKLKPERVDVLLATADFALQNKQWQTSIDACQALVKQKALPAVVHRIWGDALLGLGRPEEAVTQWKQGQGTLKTASADFQLRLAAAYLGLNQPTEAEAALNQLEVFVGRSKFDESHIDFARLRSTVQMLRAHWHLQRSEWAKAAPLLRSIALAAPGEARGQEDLLRRVEAWRMLAEREVRLERYDLAAEHLEHAITLQPTNTAIRLATAQAYTSAGNWQEALRHVSFVLRREPQSADALLLHAHLRLATESRLPVADRNWDEFSGLIQQVEQSLPDDYRVSLLKVGLLLAKDPKTSRDRALEILRQLSAQHPDVAPLQAGLVMTLEQLGDSAGADQSLSNWQRLAGKVPASRLRHVELCLHRGQTAAAREELQSIEPELSFHERHRAARLWLRIESQAGNPSAVSQAWQRLATSSPDDPYPLLLLSEAALRTSGADVEKYERQLRAIEGESGAAWRYVRARRLMSIEPVTNAAKAESIELSHWLTKHRPGWPQTWTLSGVMAEQQQDWDRAIAAYQQVVLIDGSQLAVYERLIRILYQQGRFSEVDRFVAALASQGTLSPESSLIAIGSAAAQQEVELALQLAQEAVQASPGNIPATLWLAHLQQVKGETAAAEATIAALLQRAPQDARAWGGRLALLQARGERQRFATVLHECEACKELPAKPKSLLLAQGYELLGYPERAATHYQRAIDAGQQDASTQLRLATVQLQFDPAQAEQTLRALRVKSPESAAARRMLAITLAARRQEALWPEIQELLQADGNAQGSEDLRLEAMLRLQAQKPEEISQARKLFEQLTTQSKRPVAQDRQLLAMLYEQEGKIAEAQREHLALAEDSAATVEHLTGLIAFSLRQRDTDSATRWIKRLQRRDTDPWIARRLQALTHHIAAQKPELTTLLDDLENNKRPTTAKTSDLVTYRTNMAQLYSLIEMPADVERHLRAMSTEDAKQSPILVDWLVKQQRLTDALAVALAQCDRELTPTNVTVLAQVLPLVKEPSEATQRSETILTNCSRDSQDASLLSAISNLRLLQQRSEEAIAILRRIVTLAPDDALSLNNLAALLADRDGEQANALKYIDKAIEASPRPQPFMLDTRAKVLLHQNRAQEALSVLENVVARWPETDSRVYLHLSIAYDRTGQHSAARNALAQARSRGLQLRDLTPGDRLQLEELDGRLAKLERLTSDTMPEREATP